jgi:hypothetical protein
MMVHVKITSCEKFGEQCMRVLQIARQGMTAHIVRPHCLCWWQGSQCTLRTNADVASTMSNKMRCHSSSRSYKEATARGRAAACQRTAAANAS